MEQRWVIKLANKYLVVSDREEMFTDNIWRTLLEATRFHSEQLALEALIEYRSTFNWGGIFQIEKIFISR